MKYEDNAVIKCLDTDEFELVNVFEFVPRVQLVVDIMPGTKNYRRITLVYAQDKEQYMTEIYGRTFSSRGPKVKSNNDLDRKRFSKRKFDKY